MQDASPPTWHPKSPLSPTRLAKIANALGVSTPVSQDPRRSPSSSPVTSRFLLHVIPPLKLEDLDPPSSIASGYHTQFRRGIFVPFHATFQSQLWAIAKEYALPSTTGILLFLVDDRGQGPRLSEDIWKHLWSRVSKEENLTSRSTPQLIQPLRPLNISPGPYPSPSTPSSGSRFTAISEPETPATSPEERANSLDLPGLTSPSIVPVLAKVEFDIDNRKAGWFEPWLRSRRLKQAESRSTSRSSESSGRPLLQLQLVDKSRSPPLSTKLSESPVDIDIDIDSDSDSDYGDDETARVVSSEIVSGSPPDDKLTNALYRKNIPPPLILHPAGNSLPAELTVPSPVVEASPAASTPDSTTLPYLKSDGDDDSIRPPASAKREGAFYDDLDLGLDPSIDIGPDDDDPDDHRKTQLELTKQLDEIERASLSFVPFHSLIYFLQNLAQFSPRALKMDLREDQLSSPAFSAPSLSPPPMTNADVFPPTPTTQSFDPETKPTWPVRSTSVGSKKSKSPPSSPPRLTINGLASSPPEDVPQVSYPALTPHGPNSNADSPLIPLSPDPFGRYPSASEPDTTSRASSAYWETVPPNASINSLHSTDLDATSSRFSADSLKGIESTKGVESAKRSTVVSTGVKTIKKLWRKSNKNSISGSITTPTTTAAPALPTRTRTPSISSPQVPPLAGPLPSIPVRTRTPSISNVSMASSGGAPSRTRTPSISNLSTASSASIPALPPRVRTPSISNNLPVTPTFGSSSPVPPPLRPGRPSQEELELPDVPLPDHRPQLKIPQFAGRSQNPSPIIATKMQPAHRSNLDRFQFDQETPYPIHRAPRSAPVSQPPSTTPSPPLPESHRNSVVRKSILKWKSATSSSQAPTPSLSRGSSANGTAPRARRPSMFGSSSSPEILPPSPQIPDQFLPPAGEPRRSHLTSPSTDSSYRKSTITRSSSPAQSVLSDDTRPSIDSSQFEMVSPRVGTLGYPYNSVDHD